MADEVEQIPGAIRKDNSMDLGMILNGVEQVVESIGGSGLGDGGKEGVRASFGSLTMDGVANGFGAGPAFGQAEQVLTA